MLTVVFGLLAAALAIVGIYSVMSYTVTQRMRELAIRSALGASSRGLLRLVLREGFAGWKGSMPGFLVAGADRMTDFISPVRVATGIIGNI